MTDITSLKGMYDRYPPEFAAWRALIDTVEETAREFGFRELNTPAVERTALYRIKSGEELLDQTYSFEDRGGREVTLVPEQTPTRARLVQARKDLSTPIKWMDTSKRWRYENVQKGRDREFFQTDIDIFGVESVAADAEIIACGARIYQKLGVADSVEFLVNDRTLLDSILSANGVEGTTAVMDVIDDKEKLSHAEFVDELHAVGLDSDTAETVADITSLRGPIDETVAELRALAPDTEATTAAIDRMDDLAAHLEAHGVADLCLLDLSIVRGLAYYTGLVFEAFDSEGELRALFGGGRYDDLVGLFGEQEQPAVGFAFGYSTTRELLQREGAWPEEAVSTDVYVAPVSDAVRTTTTAIADELRAAGLVVETDLTDRGLGGQFSYADSINARCTIIVGERDLADGEVTIRDMESGDERNVPREDVLTAVEETVGNPSEPDI
jgi:histidyl-tRNA synthetase